MLPLHERAKAAREARKAKKLAGPTGGIVLARVQAKRQLAVSPMQWARLPDDMIRAAIALAARPHRANSDPPNLWKVVNQ